MSEVYLFLFSLYACLSCISAANFMADQTTQQTSLLLQGKASQ